MTIKFTKQFDENTLRFDRNFVIYNKDTKKDKNAKPIFESKAYIDTRSVNLGNVQEKLLIALAGGHTGYACDDPDDIRTITEQDLKEVSDRLRGLEKPKLGDINISNVRYDEYYGIINLTTAKGEVLRVDLLTEAEERDGVDSSKGIFKSDKQTKAVALEKSKAPNKNNKTSNEERKTTNDKTNSLGSFQNLKSAVGMRESSNNYKEVNKLGYLGRYQFGKSALVDLGYYNKEKHCFTGKNGIKSKNNFLNSKYAQDEAFERWLPILWGYLKRIKIKQNGKDIYVDATKFLNKDGYIVIKGHKITASGLIMGAHLKGSEAVYNYLKSNGKINDTDGFDTPVGEYMTMFSGYELNFTQQEN